MRAARASAAEQTQARLLDLWKGEETFGRSRGCVTTSFTFDAELFEEQCLARFLSIQSNPNETAKAYLIEREEKLSQCFACVLVDSGHAAPDRSLRWHMLPVTLPHGGVLHAKLTLLVWENCIRLLIGSANLTEPAYRRNQEIIAVLDFGVEGSPSPQLLIEAVTFLRRVRSFAPGVDRMKDGPQAALGAFLSSIEERAHQLSPGERDDAQCALVPLVPGGDSVVKQLSALWTGSKPDKAWALSPFFDDDDHQSAATAQAFADLLTTRGDRQLTFVAPGRTMPDGTVQIDAPSVLKESSHPSLQHKFSMVEQRVEVEGKHEDRSLHAKSVWLERDGRVLYMLGSSNFTAAGLGLHPRHNIELNVAYLIPEAKSRFGKLCAQSWPKEIELNDLDGVQFIGSLNDSADDADTPPLPIAFGLALFCRDENGGRLELVIDENAPPIFDVYAKDGTSVVSSAALVLGKKQTVITPWESRRLPSSLEVCWQDKDNKECRAPWIVNVADMRSLPPPEELESLSLAELIEILTSARPLHEVMDRILKRREEKTAPAKNPEVDPHKKVDTTHFLLRRMRRVAQALEGMRNRLQQPAGSLDALRWRLSGPIGPIALAKRLADEDPEGAAFMIAEVASTLRSIAWQPSGSLRRRDISQEVKVILQALHVLAGTVPAPPSLAAYVTTSFEEMLS